jgi:hypothetical protein
MTLAFHHAPRSSVRSLRVARTQALWAYIIHHRAMEVNTNGMQRGETTLHVSRTVTTALSDRESKVTVAPLSVLALNTTRPTLGRTTMNMDEPTSAVRAKEGVTAEVTAAAAAGTGAQQQEKARTTSDDDSEVDDEGARSHLAGDGSGGAGRMRRLAMNRESARNRRKRKKLLLEGLEGQVSGLIEANKVLDGENQALRTRIQALEAELAAARHQVFLRAPAVPQPAVSLSASAVGARSSTSFASTSSYSPARGRDSVMSAAETTNSQGVPRGAASALHPFFPEYYQQPAQQQRFHADMSLALEASTSAPLQQVQALPPAQLWLLRQQLYQQSLHQNQASAVASALYTNSATVSGGSGAHAAAALRSHASDAVGASFPVHHSLYQAHHPLHQASARACEVEVAATSVTGQELRSAAFSDILRYHPQGQFDISSAETATSATTAPPPPSGLRENPPDKAKTPDPAG